jgi:hypothetical protein
MLAVGGTDLAKIGLGSGRGSVVMPVPVDDDWSSRAGKHPHVEIIGELEAATAVDLVALSAKVPGWAVRLRYAMFDGVLEEAGSEEIRIPAAPGYVVDFDSGEVVGMVEDCVERRVPTTRRMRQAGFGHGSTDAKQLLTDTVVLKYLGAGWQPPALRPGGAQRTPHWYALWANRYVWALTQDPRRPIVAIVEADAKAGHPHLTDQEVAGPVKRCRPRYLTRTTDKGRAGGGLTDVSVRLLAELGIEPGTDTGPISATGTGRQ